jgi:hypothetical protein
MTPCHVSAMARVVLMSLGGEEKCGNVGAGVRVSANPIVRRRPTHAPSENSPSSPYVRVDFGRQRRLRMGLLAALPKRYVRCVVDVNDVDLRVSRSASVSAPQRSTPALSRRRQTAPACWRELAERATPACPCPHRRLAESSAALADLTAAAVAPSLIAPLTFPTSRRAGFFRFLRTSSMRSGWSLGPSRRTHVNDVKSQQPRGVTTPTSHKSPFHSSAPHARAHGCDRAGPDRWTPGPGRSSSGEGAASCAC